MTSHLEQFQRFLEKINGEKFKISLMLAVNNSLTDHSNNVSVTSLAMSTSSGSFSAVSPLHTELFCTYNHQISTMKPHHCRLGSQFLSQPKVSLAENVCYPLYLPTPPSFSCPLLCSLGTVNISQAGAGREQEYLW